MTDKKTKEVECVGCHERITVSAFMSAARARCDACKKGTQAPMDLTEARTGPRIDGLPNPALQRLGCPYHPTVPMAIIGVSKNPDWGDIVSLQCREPDCFLLVQISEQTRVAVRTTSSGVGLEPDDVLHRWPRGGTLEPTKSKEELTDGQDEGCVVHDLFEDGDGEPVRECGEGEV